MTAPLPPGPRGSTLLGSLLDFKEQPHEYASYVARAYGDVASFRMGHQRWVIVSHPDDIQDMMTTRAELFLKPAIARKLWDLFLGQGVLTAEGEEWKRQSKLMRPAFHTKRLEAYADAMVGYTSAMMDGWADGATVDVDAAMVALTLRIVAKTLFDADVGDGGTSTVGTAMGVLQREMLEHVLLPLPVPRWWPSQRNRRKLKAIDDIEDIVRGFVATRRSEGLDRGDLLSTLVFAKDEDGRGLSDKEIRDQAMTLFFAGHETTAHAMTWMLWLLAEHPEVRAKAQAELDEMTGGRPLRAEDLPRLPYLEQVVKESMRIQPSVWVFMKEPTEDTEIRGFHIPKGTQILISPWIVHKDPRWFPAPDTFDPGRFEKERAARIPAGAYIPFSGGQRVCMGKSFAMMEARLVIGTMLQRLDPRVPDGHRPRVKAALSMFPEGGLPFVVKPRSTASGSPEPAKRARARRKPVEADAN